MRHFSVDLNVNSPYRLIYFKAWSSANETLWEALGAVVLEEVEHWKWTLKFPKPTRFQLAFSTSYLWIRIVNSQLLPQNITACLLAAIILALITMDSPPETVNPNQLFPLYVALVMVSYQGSKNVDTTSIF